MSIPQTSNSPKPSTGKFIVFEGGDGSGKSTQISLLRTWLEKQSIPCLVTREPGGTANAELFREIALRGDQLPMVELLLMIAARIDHINRKITPALTAGKWVLCDRFIDSTIAYQGYGLGMDTKWIKRLHKDTCDDLSPDLTITLDITSKVVKQRKGTPDDGIESRNHIFQQNVRQGFIDLAMQNPENHILFEADQSIDCLHQLITDRMLADFPETIKCTL